MHAMADRKTPPAPVVFQYPPAGEPVYRFRWRTRKTHPERYGSDCRIVSRVGRAGYFTAMVEAGSIVVEFRDGLRVTTFRGSIRLKGERP